MRKPKLWIAVCCIPGLNIPLYFIKPTKPTRGEVDAAWMKDHPEGRPLVWDPPADARLIDCYPGCVGINEVEVTYL